MADIRTNALPIKSALDLTASWFVATSTAEGTCRFPMTLFLLKTGGAINGNLSITGNLSVTGTLTGTASRATADADGNTISSTYLKTSGGTVSGALIVTGGITGTASEATHSVSADSATSATSAVSATNATNATNDGSGNQIDTTYMKFADECTTSEINALFG